MHPSEFRFLSHTRNAPYNVILSLLIMYTKKMYDSYVKQFICEYYKPNLNILQ